jgi:AcrR family transcriptional regulator
MVTMRERQRTEAMRRVQREAVEAFETDGFESVTVERIAEAAGVSPVSIYRWFGTKEALVLWDEYDPPLFEAITERLGTMGTVAAVREALVAELDAMYDHERSRVMARARLVINEPALMAASLVNQAEMVDALARLFQQASADHRPERHRVVASAIVAVLSVAIREWTVQGGDESLADLIGRGFEVLEETPWNA